MWNIEEPPTPQNVTPGQTIRWSVGEPGGLRSGTWSVTAARNTSDVYIGNRHTHGDVKLTLHPTMWRLACTEEYARKNLPDDEDRLRQRWEPTPEVAPGWRLALLVIVGSVALGQGKAEAAPKRGTIAWWPNPGPGGLISFKILLGAQQRATVASPNTYPVGTADLCDGQQVVIRAQYGPAENGFEGAIAERLRRIQDGEVPPSPWSWGQTHNGVPTMLDTYGLGRPNSSRRGR